MTDRAVPAQVTEDYRAEPPPSALPEQIRVALVGGAGSSATDDLYPLLLRRLRVYTSISAVALFVFFAMPLPFVWRAIQSGRIMEPEVTREVVTGSLLRLLSFLVSAVAALRLWRCPPTSLRGLRTVEFIVVGTLAAVLLMSGIYDYDSFLERYAGESLRIQAAAAYLRTFANTLYWFALLVSYGTLIPNTLRRAAIMVGPLALSPILLLAVMGLWLRPLPFDFPADLVAFLFAHLAFWLGVGVAIAVFSSSRIEILRRQAAEARKLGQYVLKEQLGAGGMGEVYRAEHVLLRRPCALKLIRPERAGDPKNLRRFEREVQVTATLTHPNTVQIFDYGHSEDGTFYYVMEYLPGSTLEEVVKRDGALPTARAIHFLRQLCGALKEAHGRGLIHRDIKPGNVMICERGGIPDVAKLLDFGLVLPPVSASDAERLTRDGAVTGTPAYLSPEQAGGQENVDARSDIYSLGALAYFLLTGQPPFAGRSGVKLLAAHLYERPEPMTALRPDIPADLEGAVVRCLAKQPEERFPDVESLDTALAACVKEWSGQSDGQAGRTTQFTCGPLDVNDCVHLPGRLQGT